ncbi:MAG: cation diffusion facilitator family transporter [Oscillospiraceae bacterium]|jgi:cation diffusion facilitator family transporter|nr:cation diffusion facilitator family transporter [Oscillospiraceae bacterium]
MLGNAALSIMKICVGGLAGSVALIGDGIDSASDVLIGAISLAVGRIISKPADKEHPWGHGRAEVIATAFLAFVLFTMGVQLIISAISRLVSGEWGGAPSKAAIIAAIISVAGKLILAWSQRFLGRRASSPMLRANAANMLGDVLISAGVLIGVTISRLTGVSIADVILTMLIGGWIIKTAVGIFPEAGRELMDGGGGTGPYAIIFDAVNSVDGAEKPHHARMRSIAGRWDIDLDIEVEPELTVREAHIIASKVENEIKSRLENVLDVMVHVEPRDDDSEEGYGLSEDGL